MWRRILQFLNLPGHHEYLSCYMGINPDPQCCSQRIQKRANTCKGFGSTKPFPSIHREGWPSIHKKSWKQGGVMPPPYNIQGRSIITMIINQVHRAIGHFGAQKTVDYIHREYWWLKIGHEVDKFCQTCPTCQATKPSNQLPQGLLHSLPIPRQPWGLIAMDFVGPFPPSEGHDYLWVILCHLTSMVHLVLIKMMIKASELAQRFIQEVVQLHGLPETIVSDQDVKFTSKFWRKLHCMLGAKFLMSTAFHPQTDGTSERAIRNGVQILRAMVWPNQKDWTVKLPMTEFALNSSISSSTGFAPFELNHRYMPVITQQIKKTLNCARSQIVCTTGDSKLGDGSWCHHRELSGSGIPHK